VVVTTTSEILSTQPTSSERERSELGSLSKSNLLITCEVKEDNTIVSVGDYSFHTKSKVVMRRRTKRAEGVILWTPQGEKPEERGMQSASGLGAFTAMNLGAADDSRREIESLISQVPTLTQDLQKASLEHAVLIARAEEEQGKQKVSVAEKEVLRKQVENLHADLENANLSRANVPSFLQEELLVNERGLGIRRTFFSLIGSIQGMHQELLRNEELLDQQTEELRTLKEARRRVTVYQKQHQTEQIKHFSAMELKRFQVMISSGESLIEEAGNIISEVRKEGHKLWEAARALTEEVGPTLIEGLETNSPKDSWIKATEIVHRAIEEDLRQVKDLRWEHVKALVDETPMQTRIESWTIRAEEGL